MKRIRNEDLANILSVAREVSGSLWFGNLHSLFSALEYGMVGCERPGCICPAVHTEWQKGTITLRQGVVTIASAMVGVVERGPFLLLGFQVGEKWLECDVSSVGRDRIVVRFAVSEEDISYEGLPDFARFVEWLAMDYPICGVEVVVSKPLMKAVFAFALRAAASTGQEWYQDSYLPSLAYRIE